MSKTEIKLIETAQERKELMTHILNDLEALEHLIDEGLLEKDKKRVGAELELNFVDAASRPAPIVTEVLERLNKNCYTAEYARFNIEINSPPFEIGKDVLKQMRRELEDRISAVEEAAAELGAKVVLTGILPTIRKSDVSIHALTPDPRYKALHEGVLRERGRNYEFHIEGIDDLITRDNPTAFGGTMTSFQVHWQGSPDEIVEKYNWAQAIAGPLLSCATNSPLFLGKRLWRETRIALFRQTSDTRKPYKNQREEEARVSFGKEWISNSILEVFKNDIAGYKPFLTTGITENSLEIVKKGKVPKLEALNFFNGTIYRWNRVCYGILDGKPSLRIENRILPAGPTLEDQMANAALWIGLMEGMPSRYHSIHELMEFSEVKSNFDKAARNGLDCQFRWMENEMIPAQQLILDELIPIARQGLKNAGVGAPDIDKYLGIISERVKSGKTGSQWTLDSFNEIKKEATQYESLVATTASMINRQNSGKPVHEWEPATLHEAGDQAVRYTRIGQVMNNTYYSVHQDDVIELVANVMKWKKIGNIPVEGDNGELVGIITKDAIIEYLTKNLHEHDLSVKDIMISELVTATPKTSLLEAMQLMLTNHLTCLPVVEKNKLVGMISERDFMTLASHMFHQLKEKEPEITEHV